MFQINEDLAIYVTRGDTALFSVTAEKDGESFLFQPDDVIRLNVYAKKNCDDVVIRKDFKADAETDRIDILLTKEDTKVGNIISKPTDYWYEVVLNPVTNPQTIIGYDDDGAKLFRLYPEGNDTEEIQKEDIPIVDGDFSETSERPLQNHVITRRLSELEKEIEKTAEKITSKDIVPITKAEYDKLYEKGTYQPDVVYLILGTAYNPDEDKTVLEIANDALDVANEALEIAKDPYGTVQIDKGGTGATTAEEVHENLMIPYATVVSYVGTGLSGVDAPNSLTFDFAPKALILLGCKNKYIHSYGERFNAIQTFPNSDVEAVNFIACDELSTEYENRKGFCVGSNYATNHNYCKKSEDGKTISWYAGEGNTSYDNHQCNESNVTYYVLAIG